MDKKRIKRSFLFLFVGKMRYNIVSLAGDGNMEIAFFSKEELYQRVSPALNAKLAELDRLGYGYITKVDIWNCLIDIRWRKGKHLELSEIVHDILHLDCLEITEYLKGKNIKKSRTSFEDKNLEIL